MLPSVAAAWSLIYYRYKCGSARRGCVLDVLPHVLPPPSRCLPLRRLPCNRLPTRSAPDCRWAHRVACRYRASLATKTRVVHKFFDELEVEVRGGVALLPNAVLPGA